MPHLVTESPLPTPAGGGVPAIGQVESDAGLGVRPKLHVPERPQGDIQNDDKGHRQVQNTRKLLGMLHLVFERQDLVVKGAGEGKGRKRWDAL